MSFSKAPLGLESEFSEAGIRIDITGIDDLAATAYIKLYANVFQKCHWILIFPNPKDLKSFQETKDKFLAWYDRTQPTTEGKMHFQAMKIFELRCRLSNEEPKDEEENEDPQVTTYRELWPITRELYFNILHCKIPKGKHEKIASLT